MKITITGSPKEIAALALKMQGRQEEQVHEITVDIPKLVKATGDSLRAVQDSFQN